MKIGKPVKKKLDIVSEEKTVIFTTQKVHRSDIATAWQHYFNINTPLGSFAQIFAQMISRQKIRGFNHN